MTHAWDEARQVRADELMETYIGWYIQPLRDEFHKGGGMDGFLITHGRSFTLRGIRYLDDEIELVGHDGEHLCAYRYSPDTMVKLLKPITAKAKKAARAMGYDTRWNPWAS